MAVISRSFLDIPPELQVVITEDVGPRERQAIACVCRGWKAIIDNFYGWNDLAIRAGIPILDPTSTVPLNERVFFILKKRVTFNCPHTADRLSQSILKSKALVKSNAMFLQQIMEARDFLIF